LAVPLHVVHDECALALVRGDDADLVWSKACVEEGGDDLFDVFGFTAV